MNCPANPEVPVPSGKICDLCMLIRSELPPELTLEQMLEVYKIDPSFAQLAARILQSPQIKKLCIVANPLQ